MTLIPEHSPCGQPQGQFSSAPSLMLKAALEYAERRWPVLPIFGSSPHGKCNCSTRNCGSPGKHPRLLGGVHSATADAVKIRDLWKIQDQANIAIATGSKSGVVVLDVDPRHGGSSSLAKLEADYGTLPSTMKVNTGGGGFHFYFDLGARIIRSSVSALGPGLDVRAEGGYVVAPPSLHASGRRYEWTTPGAYRSSPPKLPPWLARKIAEASKPRNSSVYSTCRPLQFTGKIPEGQRNTTLTQVCGSLFRYITSPAVISRILCSVNEDGCEPPLGQDEVQQIVASIARREISRSKGTGHGSL